MTPEPPGAPAEAPTAAQASPARGGAPAVLLAAVLLAGLAGLLEGLLDLRDHDARTRAEALDLLGYAVLSWLVPALACALGAGLLTALLSLVARRLRPAVLAANLFGAGFGGLAAFATEGSPVARLPLILGGALLCGALLPRFVAARRLRAAALLLVAGWLASGSALQLLARPDLRPSSGRGRPLVLLVVVDALRADALSCYRAAGLWGDVDLAGAATPRLDQLAAQGWLVPDVLSSSSWTLPAVSTLLTGLSPRRHGVRDHDALLPDGLPTLAERLAEQGYRSAAVLGNPILRPERGFTRGFDLLAGQPHEYEASLFWVLRLNALAQRRGWVSGPGSSRKLAVPTLIDGRLASRRTGYLAADEVTDAALGLVDELGARDSFLYLHYFDPHDPYQQHPLPLWPRHPELEADQLEALGARYDGEVAFLDAQLGRLFDGLRARGVYDDALVVVTADHGEEFLDHGDWLHGARLFDELVRVPLIVRFPGGRAPGPAPAEASLADVLPTLLGGLGVPRAADGLDGVDLVEQVLRAETRHPTGWQPTRTRFAERVQSDVWIAAVRQGTRDTIASLPPELGLSPEEARAWADRLRGAPHGPEAHGWPWLRIDPRVDDGFRVPPAFAGHAVVSAAGLELSPPDDGPPSAVRTRAWTPPEDGLFATVVLARGEPDGARLRVFVERQEADGHWARVPGAATAVEPDGLMRWVRPDPFHAEAGVPLRVGLGLLDQGVGGGWNVHELTLGLGDPLQVFDYQVFDRRFDPAQVTGLRADGVDEDRASLIELLDYMSQQGQAAARSLDDDELERFRQIGYIGDDDG